MKQITQVIGALPVAPNFLTQSEDEFSVAAVNFAAAETVMGPQLNAMATQMNEVAVEINAEAAAVALDAATVAADKVTVAADKVIVAADKGTVAADKAIVAADKATVIADKGTVAADKATTIAARDKAALWADSAAEVEAGRFSAKFWADQSHAAATGQLIYRGPWDASGNTYPAVPVPVKGDFYKISVAGILGGVAVMPNDDIIFNGATWDVIDNTDANKADLGGNAAHTFAAAPAVSVDDVVNLGQLRSYVPAGTKIEWTGPTAPAGFLQCPTAPTNISRTTYAALFAAIGTTWGAGDGATTFGMPWFPVGYAAVHGTSGIGSSSVGAILSHAHTDAGHSHGIPVFSVNANGPNPQGTDNGGGIASSTNTIAASANIQASGGAANLAAGVTVMMCVKY